MKCATMATRTIKKYVMAQCRQHCCHAGVLGHDVRLQMTTQIPTPAPTRKPVQTPAQYSLFTCKPSNTNKKEAERE
jgi:hypothetical protein